MGPVPALMGKVPLRLSLTFSLQLASLWANVSFPVSVGPYHSKPVSAVCVPTRGRVPTRIPASQPVDTNGTRGDGMFCCFARERAGTQCRVHLRGLIWLRHACARMGHQIAASPMARYIQHGRRH